MYWRLRPHTTSTQHLSLHEGNWHPRGGRTLYAYFFICNNAALLFVVKSVQTISHSRMERNTLSCRNNTWNLNLTVIMDQLLTLLDTKRLLVTATLHQAYAG